MTLKYSHLEGLDFDPDNRNCYSLLRDFYRDNYGIELTDYPNPTDWWNNGMDLYRELSASEGFEILHEPIHRWRPGDVIVMAIESSVGSHVAILLDNGKILHHLYGQLSGVTAYGGMFRNRTVGVYRHKDVPFTPRANQSLDIMELLPPHVRNRIQHQRSTPETGSE